MTESSLRSDGVPPAPQRLLWVTFEPPDRSAGGGAIRQSYLLEAIGRAFHTELLVVGRLQDEAVRASVAEVHELYVRPRSTNWGPVMGRIVMLSRLLLWPGPVETWLSRPARRVLARALPEHAAGADLVLVEHEAMAQLVEAVSGRYAVLTFQHLLSVMAAQEEVKAPVRRKRWAWRVQHRKAQRLEARALRAYRAVVACSDDDADALRALGPGCEVVVVPNGVAIDRFTVTPVPTAPRLLIPGTLCYAPNVDGVRWFCDEVFPLIQAAVPDVQLDVVGREPLPEVFELTSRPGIRLETDVPSMVPYFEHARVVIVPVRVGTGTRLKALEGLAAARPVVGTSIGLGGLDLVDGITARIADDPRTMAAAIVELLEDDGFADSMATAGRAFVEERYSWEAIAARYVAWLGDRLAAIDRQAEATAR